MKKLTVYAAWAGILVISFVYTSCSKKNNQGPSESEKHQIVKGSWVQTDIVLGVPVSVKVNNVKYNFATGTSMLNDPYMKAFGVAAQFTPTKGNIYHFTDSGTYRIEGTTSLILPVAGNTGNWSLDVYDAVLKLTNSAKADDPHWIAGIAKDSLALSMTVNITGLGAAPLTLILKRS